jgi:fido (protein-threonine AMPylation protein)
MQQQVAEEPLTSVLAGAVPLDVLLNDNFLRDLHHRMYGEIWSWAGRWRQRDVNIGVSPDQIAVQLRITFDNIRYRWAHTDDWTARQLGIAVHAETVRIHPFTDGNGCSTRLLADWCSSLRRILWPCNTTGTSTSAVTSISCASSMRIATLKSSRDSSRCSRSTSSQ